MNKEIDKAGRLIIPVEIRQRLKIKSGDRLEIIVVDDKIILKKLGVK